jgi:hypothetical protein
MKHTRINDEPFDGFQDGYYWPDKEEAEANTARIVACENACAGMEDPAAEIARLRERIEHYADQALERGLKN